jgi:hypothetical protein
MFHQLSYFSLLATNVSIATLEILCTSYSVTIQLHDYINIPNI